MGILMLCAPTIGQRGQERAFSPAPQKFDSKTFCMPRRTKFVDFMLQVYRDAILGGTLFNRLIPFLHDLIDLLVVSTETITNASSSACAAAASSGSVAVKIVT